MHLPVCSAVNIICFISKKSTNIRLNVASVASHRCAHALSKGPATFLLAFCLETQKASKLRNIRKKSVKKKGRVTAPNLKKKNDEKQINFLSWPNLFSLYCLCICYLSTSFFSWPYTFLSWFCPAED